MHSGDIKCDEKLYTLKAQRIHTRYSTSELESHKHTNEHLICQQTPVTNFPTNNVNKLTDRHC